MVSVVLPNYNHEAYLEERIQSILNQTYQDFELILLDDCSTDNSRIILQKYRNHPKVTACIFNTINSGSTFVQWEKGISEASGEYIWLAESDDYADTMFLESIVAVMSKDKQITLGYCQSSIVDEHSNFVKSNKEWTDNLDVQLWSSDFVLNGNSFISKYLFKKNVIPNASAVVFRRDAMNLPSEVKKMRMAGDWLAIAKIIQDKKICFVSEELNYFRSSPNNTRIHKGGKRIRRFKEGFQQINYFYANDMISLKQFLWRRNDDLTKWYTVQSSLPPMEIKSLGVIVGSVAAAQQIQFHLTFLVHSVLKRVKGKLKIHG
ncbi:MAG: glycosyltransferase [Cyclobacteriaceae bacterium]